MSKIKADSIPNIFIQRLVESDPEHPSIHLFEVQMVACDWDLDSPELAEEVFANAKIVLFDPNLGNPTDDADAQNQELFDVATAFYDPDGELSNRALARQGANFSEDHPFTPALAYVQSIDALAGFERGGRIEAGIALALRQIYADLGHEAVDIPLQIAIHQDSTLRLIEGVDVLDPHAKATPASLGKSFLNAFRLESWVAPGQSYASEIGHGAAGGEAMPDGVNRMLGYGGSSGADTLLGCSNFEHGVELVERARSDKELEKWMAARQAAHKAAKPERPSLGEEIARLSARIADAGGFGSLDAKDSSLLRQFFQEAQKAMPGLQDVAAKVKAKRQEKTNDLGGSRAAPK